MRTEEEIRQILRVSVGAVRKLAHERNMARNVVSDLERWKARAETAETEKERLKRMNERLFHAYDVTWVQLEQLRMLVNLAKREAP